MEAPSNRISRRRMLKRIGAGAAVAWSAPIISSLRTPAFAAYPPTVCDPGQTCPDCPERVTCQGNENCQCWSASNDQGDFCVCTAFVASCGLTPACPGGQSECTDPNFPTCVESCCGRFCAPPCGAPAPRGRTEGAKTTR